MIVLFILFSTLTMIKNTTSLLKTSPFLFILGGAQVLGHDHLAWLWGGVFWLMTSRLYLIPRRMQRFSAATIPDLIGGIYGVQSQIIVGAIHVIYYTLLLITTLQRWYAFGYMEVTPRTCLWIVVACWILIILCAVIRSVYFSRTVVGGLLMIVFMLLPVLVHLLRPRLDLDIVFATTPLSSFSSLYTTYLPAIDPSIFLVTVLFGHPLLSHELLENSDTRKTMRLFKLAGITLICLAITNSIVLRQLGENPTLTPRWQLAIFVYRAITYLLSAGLFLYMAAIHMSKDVLGPLLESSEYSKRTYFLAAIMSGFIVGISYAVPEDIVGEASLLSIIPLAVSQFILIVILIGLCPCSLHFYVSLLSAPIIYIALRLVSVPWLEPYVLGIAVLATCLFMLVFHCMKHKGFCLNKRNWWEKQEVEEFALRAPHIKKAFWTILCFPFKMAFYARQGVARQRTPYASLNLYFGLIALLAIHLWPLEGDAPYIDLAYGLFFFNLLCCVVSLLQPIWPRLLAPYFALYWHFYLTCYLVTTPVVLYIISSYDPIALVNLVLSIILLARFVSPLSFFVVHMFGLLNGLLILQYFMPDALALLLEQPKELYTLTYSYLAVYLAGALFIRKNRQEVEETKQKLKSLVKKSIAIVSNALNITKSYASMIELCTHTMDVTEEPDSEDGHRKVLISMDQNSYTTMTENLTKLLDTMNTGRAQLKRVFLPINGVIKKQEFAEYHASPCVREAIETFMKDYEAQKQPKLYVEEDFTFQGSDQALISALIQLLRNSHEYSHTQGDISLYIRDHKIYITNDGSAIKQEDLPHIFNEFFTTNPDNLGLGLFFAKEVMESFNGKIYLCPNYEEDKTCLVLAFPEK